MTVDDTYSYVRFSDEAARVRLSYGQQPGSDYINASFIDVSNTLVSNKHLHFPMYD